MAHLTMGKRTGQGFGLSGLRNEKDKAAPRMADAI